MLEIGNKVICVDASIQNHMIEELSKDVPNWVKQDEIYTVRGFNNNKGIVVGVLLEEISNPIKFFKLTGEYQEPAFATWRFRKQEEAYIDSLEIEEESIREFEVLEN